MNHRFISQNSATLIEIPMLRFTIILYVLCIFSSTHVFGQEKLYVTFNSWNLFSKLTWIFMENLFFSVVQMEWIKFSQDDIDVSRNIFFTLKLIWQYKYYKYSWIKKYHLISFVMNNLHLNWIFMSQMYICYRSNRFVKRWSSALAKWLEIEQ